MRFSHRLYLEELALLICLCFVLARAVEFWSAFTGSVNPGQDAEHQEPENSKNSREDIYFEILEPETLRYTFKVRPAQDFGTVFNETLRNVGLVLAEPSHGCSAPINRLELKYNVALIERGSCSFLSKCIQAQYSGVIAVVIADNDVNNDDQYIDMIDDNTKRNCSIPAVFLLGKDGHMIRKSLKAHQLTRAIINIPVNITFIPPHKQKHPPWVLW